MIYDYEITRAQQPVQLTPINPWANISASPETQANRGMAGGAEETVSGVISGVGGAVGQAVPMVNMFMGIGKAGYKGLKSTDTAAGDAFATLFGPHHTTFEGIDYLSKGVGPGGNRLDSGDKAELALQTVFSLDPLTNMITSAIWGNKKREREQRQQKMLNFVNRLNRAAGEQSFNFERPTPGASAYLSDVGTFASGLGGLVDSFKGKSDGGTSETKTDFAYPSENAPTIDVKPNDMWSAENYWNTQGVPSAPQPTIKMKKGGSILLPSSGGIDKIALIDTSTGQDTGVRVSGEEMLVVSKETLSGLKSALSKGDKKKVFSLMQEQMNEKPEIDNETMGFVRGALFSTDETVSGQQIISVDGVPYIKYTPDPSVGGKAKWYPMADSKDRDKPGVMKIPGQKDLYARTQQITKFGALSENTLSEEEGDKIFMSQNPRDATYGANQAQIAQITQRRQQKALEPYQARVESLTGYLKNLEEQVAAMDVEDQVKYNKKLADVKGQLNQAKLDYENFRKGMGSPTRIPFAPTAGPAAPPVVPGMFGETQVTETQQVIPVGVNQQTSARVAGPVNPAAATGGRGRVSISGGGTATGTTTKSTKKARTMAQQRAYEATLTPLQQNQLRTPQLSNVNPIIARGSGVGVDSYPLLRNDVTPEVTTSWTDYIGPAVGGVFDISRFTQGMQGAQEQVPQWSVPAAWNQYLEDARQMANVGLSSQQMSNMQQQADRQYITDVANIRGLSGGNVGTLLGNLGRANLQRSQTQADIAALDRQAQLQNLARYGSLLAQDINLGRIEFGDRYNQAMMTKQAGAQLANDAMRNMIERIDFERYYGPQSQQAKMNQLYQQKTQEEIDIIKALKEQAPEILSKLKYGPSASIPEDKTK